MFGIKQDFICELPKKYYTLRDYEKGVARWCPGCGDHAVLSSGQRPCRDQDAGCDVLLPRQLADGQAVTPEEGRYIGALPTLP